MKRSLSYCLMLLSFIIIMTPTLGLQFPLKSPGDDLYGQIQITSVESGDDFAKIARRYDLGYYELVEANPQVNPDHPPPGTVLIIPTQFLLPHVLRTGIVINLASMRIYYFPRGANYFYTYPIGIGRQDWSTPLGILQVIQKIVDPTWHVPESVFRFRQDQGDPVPKVVPPGPDNPLGKLAMRLSKPTYLIHDTNDPSSVGRRSSAGCIHLYSEDIQQLFDIARVGTKVLIINQPYIAAWNQGKLYIEAHLPLEEQRQLLSNPSEIVLKLINELSPTHEEQSTIDWQKAAEIIKDHTGIPTVVNGTNAAR